MLAAYLSLRPVLMVLPWILQAIGYYFILKKMELRSITAIVPIAAEHQMSSKLFKRRRSFYRPAVISVIFVAAALYLGRRQSMSYLFLCVVFLIYGIFLFRMYWRLSRAFGKGKFYAILLTILPPVFLLVLGLGKAQFTQPEFKPDKERSRVNRAIRHVLFAVISIIEVLVIVAGVAFQCIRTTPPAIIVKYLLNETYTSTKDITGGDSIVTREDVLGADSKAILNAKHSRDYFFPDHSNDQSVVVMTYIIGADLEGGMGLASANIQQMIEATKKGPGLKFVVEAGGSERWFTPGIANRSYGRYEIADGNITKIEDLPAATCMSSGEALTDFITWAKETYPADRNLLVMWDHGGGVAHGYGQDNVNRGHDNLYGTIDSSEVVKAIGNADIKFDIIGFDACLMQDIEIAKALEPYADYYLASEEVEGGYGWFYTSGFGMLAENPGTSSYDFGREMVSCYDPYNTIIKDGETDTTATLSFVDLTLAAPAYDKLEELFEEMATEIKDNRSSYANIAIAANSTYAFHGDDQIDLVDFLQYLDDTDYNENIMSHKEKASILRKLQASILIRNAASAKGINGMAFAFPYKAISSYGDTTKQFKALKCTSEKKAFDEVFSIIASKKKQDALAGNKKHEGGLSLNSIVDGIMGSGDFTTEPWYIEGFEDYDNINSFVDIPLKEVEDGYQIQLPDKVWKNIVDCKTHIYQHMDAADASSLDAETIRYLGSDYIGGDDENGHPLVVSDGYWPHLDDQIMCYDAQVTRETEDGFVYNGTAKARLNNESDINLYIDWDAVKDDEDPAAAHIVGYTMADDEGLMSSKGLMELSAGDSIQFVFDYFDVEGNLVESKPDGKVIRVTSPDRLTIEYKPIEASTIEFGGILTDIYQRTLTTEMVVYTNEE